VICFDRVACVLPDGVQGGGDQLVEDPRADVRAAGRDLNRDRSGAHRLGEEAPGGRQVTPRRQQDVDDLAMLTGRSGRFLATALVLAQLCAGGGLVQGLW